MNVFLGFSEPVLSSFHQILGVQKAFFESRSDNAKAIDFCEENAIEYQKIDTAKDIQNSVGEETKIDLCMVAGFGIILKDGFIKNCGKIINFHPADVRKIRGRHAFPQSIYNREELMIACAHIIDSEKIDAGPIVGLLSLPFNYSKAYQYNDVKMQLLFGRLAEICLQAKLLTGEFDALRWELGKSTYFQRMPEEYFVPIIKSENLGETLQKLP